MVRRLTPRIAAAFDGEPSTASSVFVIAYRSSSASVTPGNHQPQWLLFLAPRACKPCTAFRAFIARYVSIAASGAPRGAANLARKLNTHRGMRIVVTFHSGGRERAGHQADAAELIVNALERRGCSALSVDVSDSLGRAVAQPEVVAQALAHHPKTTRSR